MENLAKTYIGIDISKKKFDVAYFKKNEKKASKKTYQYDTENMEIFLSEMPIDGHFVMEFTGIYHLKLLLFLQEKGCVVSVVTGEQVRYFGKMDNNMSKTDGQDAVLICQYASIHHPKLFKLLKKDEINLKQKRTYLRGLSKTQRFFENQLESVNSTPTQDESVVKNANEMIEKIKEQKNNLEKEIQVYLKDNFEDDMKNLQTIDGVGKKTAMEFILAVKSFQGFENDTNGKAFVKYLGLSPTIYQSGSSVRRKSTLPQRACTELRDKMFMPILGLCVKKDIKKGEIFRKYCNGLIARGKTVKQALMATIHKIVRVMLAVFKSGKPFDENLYGKRPTE